MAGFSYAIWFLSELLLNRFLRSKTDDQQNSDRSSLGMIWLTIIICITLAVIISTKFSAPIGQFDTVAFVGISLIWFGIILRMIVIYSLGRFFTVDVTIRQDHQLKKNGLYSYLRHPSYSASLISFLGFGLSRNNWISLLVVFIPVLFVFVWRIKVEERVLIKQFGDEYLTYRKSTSALIPFIF